MGFRVDQVDDHQTWALRQSVLRPHQTVDQVAGSDPPDGGGPLAAAFAALDDRAVVVGTVLVAPAPPPPVIDHAPLAAMTGWRLRGMAVQADLRNHGLGGRLLDRAVAHVAGHGGGLLWCNARVPAMGLYRRSGFVPHGEPWVDPDIGPHVVMARTVTATEPPPG